MPHVLLVDDEPSQRHSLRKALESNDFKVAEATSVLEAEEKFSLSDFDLIVTELKLPGMAGSELIRLAQPVPVVVMTNYASLRSAVDSMKLGAVDYLAKPCSAEDLLTVVRTAIADFPKVDEKQPTQTINSRSFFEGSCESMARLQRDVLKVAVSNLTVLISGETGTGKEITAKQVHESSPRRDRPLLVVNCAAIPDTLIESELFGYEKGAFTGANANRIGLIEAADGGTLFLDEIGELPLAAQARLLRFIQEGEIRRIGSVTTRQVDVRLICATHRDLAALAETNEFRRDLYYRINALRLNVPPLRERGNDLPAMAMWFTDAANQRNFGKDKKLSDRSLSFIAEYRWPGNVRELEHAIDRGVIMAEGRDIEIGDLGLPTAAIDRLGGDPAEDTNPLAAEQRDREMDSETELSLEDYFQRFVLEHQEAMSETELAQKLGISRKCLWERRQRFNLPRAKAPGQRSA